MAKSVRADLKKSGRGGPRTAGTTPNTTIRLSASILDAVKRWGKAQVDNPNKTEAIRRLLEPGLKAKWTGGGYI
jgi:hypothetical protein